VIGLAFALPDVGDDARPAQQEDAAATSGQEADAAGGEGAEAVRMAVQERDYDEAALEELARGAGGDTLDAPQAAATTEFARSKADEAIACVNVAFEGAPSGRLVRVIDARFHGRDAYIALYLEGPGAGQPPDTAAVYVAAQDDCALLTLTTTRLSS
jgi:hypothetical protein